MCKKLNYLFFKFLNIPFQISGPKELLEDLRTFWKDMLENLEISNFPRENDEIWNIHIFQLLINNEKTHTNIIKKEIYFCIPESENILLRTINMLREVLVKISLTQGYNWLHGSSFSIDGKTFVVLGNKGDGKTTWLMRALFNNGAKFIGNDQIPIILRKNGIYVYRWRPDIKVHPSSLNKFTNHENIEDELTNNRYIILPFQEQYKIIDFNAWSKISNQNIKPYPFNAFYDLSEKANKVYGIIFLSKSRKGFTKINDHSIKTKLLSEYYNDPEVIFPIQMLNWSNNKSYWNRIKYLPISKSSIDKSERCMKHFETNIPFYLVNNRLKEETIEQVIEKIKSEN